MLVVGLFGQGMAAQYLHFLLCDKGNGTSELLVRHTRTAFSPDDAHVCPPA